MLDLTELEDISVHGITPKELVEKLETCKKGSGNLDKLIYDYLVQIGLKIGMPFTKSFANYTTDLQAIMDVVQGNKYLCFFIVFSKDEENKRYSTTLHFVDFVHMERAVSATGYGKTPALSLCATLFKAFMTLEIL